MTRNIDQERLEMKGYAMSLSGNAFRLAVVVLSLTIATYFSSVSYGQDCIRYENYFKPAGFSTWPSGAVDLIIEDDVLFVAGGFDGFAVFDVSDRQAPTTTFTLDTRGARGLARGGDNLYIADFDSGLVVLDLDDPRSPRVDSRLVLPGRAISVAVSRSFAYVASEGDGLHIVDIETPSDPRHLRTIPLFAVPNKIVIKESHLYLCLDSIGVLVYSLTVPEAPVYIATLVMPQPALSFDMKDGIGYVGCGNLNTGSVEVVDLSDPANPVPIVSLPVGYSAYDVEVSDTYLYVAVGARGLQSFSIDDPSDPQYLGSIDVSSVTKAVAVDETFAYRANDHGGLDIVELGNRMSPPIVANVDLPKVSEEVRIYDDLAIVAANNWDGDLYLFDISHPAAPVVVGSMESSFDWITGMEIDGNIVAVSDHWFDDCCAYGSIHFLDVADKNLPAPLSSLPTWGTAVDIAVYEKKAYVADGNSGLTIYDYNDPRNPFLVSLLPLGQTTMVEIIGNYLYLAVAGDLQIWQLDKVQLPTYLAEVDLVSPHNIVRNGDLGYVADDYQGIIVLDLVDPANPVLVHTEPTRAGLRDLAIVDDVLYAAASYRGLWVFDITDPRAPEFKGKYDALGGVNSIEVNDGLPFLACSITGFVVASPQCQGISGVPDDGSLQRVADRIVLSCYPNPFNPQTTIAFDLPEQAAVDLRVFDVSGRLVNVLIDGEIIAEGHRTAAWSGRDDVGKQVAAGVYFYRLDAGEYSVTKRMVLVK